MSTFTRERLWVNSQQPLGPRLGIHGFLHPNGFGAQAFPFDFWVGGIHKKSVASSRLMKIHTALLLVLVPLVFAGCGSDQDTTCEFYFTARSGLANSPWTLRVDGQLIGTLTVPETAPNCSNLGGSIGSLLHVTLSSERHRIEAFDNQGTKRYNGYVKSDENSSSAGGNKGGASMAGNCDCFIIEVFE